MRAINLFSGMKSVASVLESRGWDVTTSDIDCNLDPDICVDILNLKPEQLHGCDFIWASPPCECFSVASIGHHWNKDRTPKTENAKQAIKILHKTIEIIEAVNPRYWIIENPRGMMRKIIPENFDRRTVTYCQYGDKRMKPTDLWGHFPDGWLAMACKNGSPCHESAPRGSRTGTQGIKGYHNRSAIPRDLILSLIEKIIPAP